MKTTVRALSAISAISAGMISSSALAQPVLIADSGDSGWVLVASVLVFIGIPGAALFYGRGRAASLGMILLITTAIATLLFVGIGYSLAFGDGSSLLGGAGNAMLGDLLPVREGATISEGVFAFFELCVALFALAILVAAIAGRARTAWLIPFAGLWLLLVYVPVARWIWSGWLSDLGAADFGGGIVVQITVGVAALVVGFMVRDKARGRLQVESPLPLVGAAFMWVAWLALLGGKIYGAGEDAAAVIFNAQVAAAAAVLAAVALDRWRHGAISGLGAAGGALSGIAAISAGADSVGIGGAMLIGIAGALASHGAAWAVGRAGVDSTANAFSTTAAPAMAGAIAFPLFVPILGGAGFADNASLVTSLAAQAVAVVSVSLWAVVATAIAALMVSMVIPMRPETDLS